MEEEEENHYETGSLYVVTIDPYLLSQNSTVNETQYDQNHTVDYFKSTLDSLIKADNRMQKKLKQSHRLQRQLSLFINKNIDSKYGLSLQDNSSSAKSLVHPLPPIEKGVLSDLLRVLHSLSPTDLKKFVNQSGIIEQLIFADSSIFNSRLLENLVRTPPDIQISFIVSIIDQIRQCSKFFHKLTSKISEFALENSFRRLLIDSNSNLELFFNFYEKSLGKIAKICKSDECKIVFYSDESQKLIFPTKELTYIISVDDSLSGSLIQKNKPIRIEFPRQEKLFEATTEGKLFSEDDPILSVPIKVGQSLTIGILIFIRHSSKFSVTDELISTKISQYLRPILQLFRSIFTQINASQYSQLFQCTASIRSKEKPFFELVKDQFCILTSATFCKLYINGSLIDNITELKQLPQEDSLVRKSFEAGTIESYKNPRSHPNFNKEVDDESSLSKITSILIVPVKNSPLVIVLYNPLSFSEFTSSQKKLASFLSLSMQPILKMHSMLNKSDELNSNQENENVTFGSIVDSFESDKFYETIKKLLPEGIETSLYLFTSNDKALKLPMNELIEIPKKLSEIAEKQEEVHIKKYINNKLIEYDCDSDVKSLIVIPSKQNDNKAICTFVSKDTDMFDGENGTFCRKLGRILLLLLLPHICRKQLRSIQERSILVDGAVRLSTDSISHFVGANIECHFFDKPMTKEPQLNKPLSIFVETPRGIEAALTSDAPVKNEASRNAFVSFAELMSTILSSKKCQKKESLTVCISSFVEFGVLDVFGCTGVIFNEWIESVFSLYEECGVDPLKKYKSALFVNKMICEKKWESWFSNEEKIVIVLIVFLSDIEKCWRCTVDDQLISIFNELNCRPVSGLFCSILFGAGMGIFGDSENLSRKKLLIKIVDNFAVCKNVKDMSNVSSHIRLISQQMFKQNERNKIWLGRSLVLISELHEFADLNESAVRKIAAEMNDVDRKKIIFKIERVFVPMLTSMSQRNETIETILTNIRNSLKILHGIKS